MDAYKRRYKMRAVGQDGLNIIVSIPRVVVERQAEKQGLTVGQFLKQFKAVAQYDNFEGIIYTFEETNTKTSQKPMSRDNGVPALERLNIG